MRPSLPRERLFLLLCVCWRSRGTRPIWRPTVLRERCLFFFFFFFFFFACVSREDGNGLERTFLDSFNNFFFLFFFDSLLLLLLQRLFSIPLLFCACGSVRKEIPYNPLPTTSFFFLFLPSDFLNWPLLLRLRPARSGFCIPLDCAPKLTYKSMERNSPKLFLFKKKKELNNFFPGAAILSSRASPTKCQTHIETGELSSSAPSCASAPKKNTHIFLFLFFFSEGACWWWRPAAVSLTR